MTSIFFINLLLFSIQLNKNDYKNGFAHKLMIDFFVNSLLTFFPTYTAPAIPSPDGTTIKLCPLFSRITRAESEYLALRLKEMPLVPLKKYCDNIKAANFSHPLFEKKDWFLFAIQGFFQGYMSDTDIAQASHLDLYLQQNEGTSFLDGSTDDTHINLTSLDDLDTLNDILSSAELTTIDIFDLSPLEKVVFKVTLSKKDSTDKTCIFHRYSQLHYHRFCSQKWAKTFYITSLPCLNRLLENKPAEHRLTLFPTFGYSLKLERFIDVAHERAIFFACRYISYPEDIHGYRPASFLCFTFHDFYHAWITHFDPYRQLENDIAKRVLPYFRDVAIHLFDREFRYYELSNHHFNMHKFPITKEEAFWTSQIHFLKILLPIREDQCRYLEMLAKEKIPSIGALLSLASKYQCEKNSQLAKKIHFMLK